MMRKKVFRSFAALENFFLANYKRFDKEKVKTKVIGKTMFMFKNKERGA